MTHVAVFLGLALGSGVILVVSPFRWPRSEVPRRSRLSARAHERLVQAGLDRVSPAVVVAVASVLAVATGAVAFALVRILAFALVAAIVAGALPVLALARLARSRREAARVLWPDVVDQLVSAIRAGLALPDAVSALSRSGPDATRPAFAGFETSYSATGSFALALDELKVHLADPVADRLIETLRMAREVGGSELTTVLRNLGGSLREDAAIRSEVAARQSWVTNAARLGVAAPWVVVGLISTRPEAATAYNTPAGTALIVGGLVISTVAYRLMIALGRLPEQRRWFA